MHLVRRHPIALLLAALILLAALWPLPALVDAVTGAVPGDVELVRPPAYVALAPLSDVLDALTFLTLERARALLLVWGLGLAAWGALRPGSSVRLRVGRALVGPLALLLLGAAAVLLPRPVPSLTAADSSATVIDYHSHTEASWDARAGWTAARLARWHAGQGFQAAYVTDHNALFDSTIEGKGGGGEHPVRLLPGAEWSVYRLHVVALGAARPIDRERFSGNAPAMLRLFAELHAQGAMGIASLPEYWMNYWDDLDALIAAGADGFEIMNCAPKALAFPTAARRRVVELAARHDVMVVGASDHHGWGKASCVWNLAHPSEHGYRANRVYARPLALAQGDWPAWAAAWTQAWLMFRSLSWSERVSWLTWILLLTIYRGVPRRQGQGAGLGILARSLSLRGFFTRAVARPT